MLGFIHKMAKALAVAGGIVLLLIVIVTCSSVMGRGLNTLGNSDFVEAYLPFLESLLKFFGPINGDYELVEAGTAVAIFMFLPWCQLSRGHASVELFTSLLPAKPNRFLALLWEIVFSLVIILITWRIYEGMISKLRNGETSFLLQMPIWWPYAICTFTACIASIVSMMSVWLHAKDLGSVEAIGDPVEETTR
jgi:TRAP-type C4-dicarboxylate transport system permease small subunit